VVKTPIAQKAIAKTVIVTALLAGTCGLSHAQDAADRYAATLQQISDAKLVIAQKEAYIATQEKRIAALRTQLASVGKTKEAVGPMLAKMASAIEDELNSDIPFKVGERFNRLEDFKEALADNAASPGEQMRKALNIYDIEVGYGNSVSAYPGNHPKSPGTRFAACEADKDSGACGLTKDMTDKMKDGATISDLKSELMDGSYLHYGRMALVYLQYDSSEAWRWDKEAKDWTQLSGGDVLNVRRAVRIARGESAPGVVTAPTIISE